MRRRGSLGLGRPWAGGRVSRLLELGLAGSALLLVPCGPRASAQTQTGAATYFCEVSQPYVSRDERRVEIHRSTYALKLTSPIPGAEIQFTCHPSTVVVLPELARDTIDTSEIANLNAANLLGLRVRIEIRPAGTWSSAPDTSGPRRGGEPTRERFYVDELHAELHVGALTKRPAGTSTGRGRRDELAQYDALVAATVQCMVENAQRSRPPIRRLRISVVGWERYRHLSDVYPIATDPERKEYRY